MLNELRGEIAQRTIYFFLLYALITMGSILGEVATISIFINRIGLAYLSYFFALAPLGVGLVIFLFSLAANRFDKVTLCYFIFSLSVLIYAVSTLGNVGAGWLAIPLLFYIWLINPVQVAQFFSLVSDGFSVKEGQIAVPIIAMGWFVGNGVAGSLGQNLTKFIHTPSLLYVSAWFYAAALLLLYIIRQRFKERLKRRRIRGERLSSEEVIAFLKRNHLFRNLLVSVLLLWLAYIPSAFQFFSVGASYFPSEDMYTAYYGTFILMFSLLGLIAQISFTPRFIRYFGIPWGLPFSSLLILAAGLLLVVFRPNLLTSFLAYLIPMLVRDSIHISSFQFYFNQAASHLRSGLRNLIEGVMSQIGMSVAGILILVLNQGFKGVQFVYALAILMILFAGGGFFFNLRIRKRYEEQIYKNTLAADFELRLNAIEALQDKNNKAALYRIEREAKEMRRSLEDRVNFAAILSHVKGGVTMEAGSKAEYQSLKIVHETDETPRFPREVCEMADVILTVATFPKRTEKAEIWVDFDVSHLNGKKETGRVAGSWTHNKKGFSYWLANLGSFKDGDTVDYMVSLRGEKGGIVNSKRFTFKVAPRIYLNLILNVSQPAVIDFRENAYLNDKVRLHAVYYYHDILTSLYSHFHNVHLTVNIVPAMLEQLLGYVRGGIFQDKGLALARKAAAALTEEDRKYILKNFFTVEAKAQIDLLPRYRELLEKRDRAEQFGEQDFLDLMACYNLVWFSLYFFREETRLVTGEAVGLKKFIRQGRNFTSGDVAEIINEQVKVIGSLLKILFELEKKGQVEVSVSPYFHPNLPLVYDSDQARLPNLPARFFYPQDVVRQVELALNFYRGIFKKESAGLWPPDAALSPEIIPLFAEKGIRWIASDVRLLAKSDGGFNPYDPNTVAQGYRFKGENEVACFFSDAAFLDDFMGLYAQFLEKQKAADDFISKIKYGYGYRVQNRENKVLTIVIDSVAALSVFKQNLKEILFSIFARLDTEKEIKTLTPSEFISGNLARGIPAHPVADFPALERLATGSWYGKRDKINVDLASWIGGLRTNYAWELLRITREALEASGARPETQPRAYAIINQAESSYWFLWYDDPDKNALTEDHDAVFRGLLSEVYAEIKQPAPEVLGVRFVPEEPYWNPEHMIEYMEGNVTLTIQTYRGGKIKWGINGWDEVRTEELVPLVRKGFKADIYQVKIDVRDDKINELNFSFVWEDGTEERRENKILVDWGFEQIVKNLPAKGAL